ncbi:MAG: DUF58 domain-containing protein [Planctomycetes bacterium]|nr:DUF58 domain-containing protein [Planctomycetota bacterium]
MSLDLEPGFLNRLERVAIVARKTLKGLGHGARRSKRSGGAVEFADYRRYTPGDDPRQIDWYAYARFEALFVKLFMAEQDLQVHLICDHSASMRTGSPPKLPFAWHVLLALAYVGLAAGDRVQLNLFADAGPHAKLGPLQGRRGLARLIGFLKAQPEPSAATDLGRAIRGFLARRPAPGVALVISDFLDPQGFREPLERLRYSGFEPHVIHVVSPDEVDPRLGPDVELVDVETGETHVLALDRVSLAAYKARFQGFCAELQALCAKHEIGYARARSDTAPEAFVLETLRRSSVVG